MGIDRTRRLLALAAPAALLAHAAPGAQEAREVRVVARRFVFEPATIDAVLGVPLVLRFTAPEVTMGFNLPDFKTRADLVAGRETIVRVTPDKAGSFAFVCDIFCGNGHEDMQGVLNVKG